MADKLAKNIDPKLEKIIGKAIEKTMKAIKKDKNNIVVTNKI